MSWRTSASSGIDDGDTTVSLRNSALIEMNNKSDATSPGSCESTTASSSSTSSSSSSPIGADDCLDNSLVQHDQQQQQNDSASTTGEFQTSSSTSQPPPSPQNMVVVGGSSPSDDPGGSPIINDLPDTISSNKNDNTSDNHHSSNYHNSRQSAGGNNDAGEGGGGGGGIPDGDPPSADDGGGGEKQNNQRQDGSSGGNNNNSNNNKASGDKKPQDDAIVTDSDGSDHEIPWSPQEDQSVCEFTHIIEDYSEKRDSGTKKAEYSATTVDDRGNRWRLIVYVNGNGRASNHHLSLFLQVADADDLPFGWKKAVSYVLTLEHPSGGNMSYAKRNPDKTFKMCPKAIDWGWSQFITSDKIQQEGFVQDDTLVVRASVTVKSSSVDIDLEDAELYLKCAVEEGKPDAVQLCLDQGASVNCQFKDDLYTPLHTACSANPSEDMDNETATKILDGSMKVLELLLEKGADGNACNKWQETPLLIAANNGHRQAVEALLRHGADPSLCSEAGWSALTFAAHKGYDDIVALLLKAGAPVNCRVTEDASTPLHKACAGAKVGHLSAVRLLLEGRADVHSLNKWRETPLLTAANHGQAGAVEALLRAGADPCKCTDTGWSPLSIAAYKGHDDVVKLLLDEGAPTEEADPTLSALLQAATKGLPDTVELLLRYGADHTVTTKKGDTALSILVEQNLIDAAVEMVTEYKASIPRCSRDRKKVQRARLLINLRIKQQQRDGVSLGSEDDDEGENDFDNEDSSPALVEETKQSAVKGKKKKKKKKSSAEQQAKEAEEALLLELEQEDAERSKQVEEASKKSAKKRKKKEKERQLKKEQEERRMAEERAAEELRKKEQEAKDAAEKAERERIAAARRKEEEEYRKRHHEAMQKKKKEEEERAKQQQLKEENEKAKAATTRQKEDEKKHNRNGQTAPQANKSNVMKATPRVATKAQSQQSMPSTSSAGRSSTTGQTKASVGPPKTVNPQLKRRGWESLPAKTAEPIQESPAPAASSAAKSPLAPPIPPSEHLNGAKPSVSKPAPNVSPSVPKSSSPDRSTSSLASSSEPRRQTAAVLDEPPAVSLFRREKVSELLHRCSVARATSDPLGFISETIMRKVVIRWIMRAAHDSDEYMDFLLPSWVDLEKLVAFFQRQFITESRKNVAGNVTSTMQSMESLKEAGTAMAVLCQTLAKDVIDFKRQVLQQLPSDWTDISVGMSASEIASNGGGPIVILDWAKQSQISFTSQSFARLAERFRSTQSRLLSSIFVTRICLDAKNILTGDTALDHRLSPSVKEKITAHIAASGEIWSDPFSVLNSNAFWGQSNEIDPLFGGFRPFSTDDDNDDRQFENGGSVMALIPPDSLLASRYLRRMFDILQHGERKAVPLSFAIFLQAECLVDGKSGLTANDLYFLEPRLRENAAVISRVETLLPHRHGFYNEKTGKVDPSPTGSLFVVLQNSRGQQAYSISEIGVAEIMRLMEPVPDPPILSTGLAFAADPSSTSLNMFAPQTGFAHNTNIPAVSSSPLPSNPFASDFGTTPIPGSAGPTSSFGVEASLPAHRAPTGRRGRLFDLVEDGVDDNMNEVDVVSGMLGNLNVDDLFQSSGSQEVDIEAISLMGISGTPTKPNSQHPSQNPFR